MDWQYVHKGYYVATSHRTGDSYIVRTRPKGDGWMAIADDANEIIGSGMSLFDAQEVCDTYDRQEATIG